MDEKLSENTPKSQKIKMIHTTEMRFTHKDQLYWENQTSTRCGNHHNIVPLFEGLERFLTSLIFSLRHDAHPHLAKWIPKAMGVGEGCLPQQPYGSIYSKNQKTRMPLWAKRKIHLMKGSLVQCLLRYTRCHRTDHLLLHFYVTFAMMPRAPPAVPPSPVLR